MLADNKVDDVMKRIDNLSDRVDAYKQQSEKERERRPESNTDREEVIPGNVVPIGAVAEETHDYQSAQPDMPVPISYKEAMEQFMANRVSEGVTYSCNQDAYEDFKAYYDKKMKADSMAVVQQAVSKKLETAKSL